jgi:hypothetical protein
MRALQIAVIVMGILIVLGVAVVLYEIGRRTMGGGETGSAVAGRIELPADAEILDTDVDGGRVYVTVMMADGARQVLVFDADDGAALGALEFAR